MKQSLLVAALFALALSACGKKEEAAATPAAPAATQAAPAAPVAVPAAPAEGANTGSGLKLNDVQAPAAAPEQK